MDILHLHNTITAQREVPESSTSVEDVLGEVVETFQTLQAQGKTRFYGMTGLGETAAVNRVIDAGVMQTVQSAFNLLNPSAGADVPPEFYAQDFERLIDRAAGKGMGVVVISVLAGGALSGVVERHPLASPPRKPLVTGRDYRENVYMGRHFDFLMEEGYVESRVEAAVRFGLSKGEVSTVLVGYSSLEHLEEAVKCGSRGPLPPEALNRLSEIWAEFTGG